MSKVGKFMIGDKVRVVSGADTNWSIHKRVGEEGIVCDVDTGATTFTYSLKFEGDTCQYWAKGEWLELVQSNKRLTKGDIIDIVYTAMIDARGMSEDPTKKDARRIVDELLKFMG